MSCLVCFMSECNCRFITHKSKFKWREDPIRLPNRSVFCGVPTAFEKTHSYWSKVTCKKCLMVRDINKVYTQQKRA